MPTSNTYDWTLNRTQVITGALRKLGVLASGGSPSTAQTSDAADALNAIVKALEAEGMPLWAIQSTNFTVSNGTSTYTIGPSKTINTTSAPLKIVQALRTVLNTANVPMNVYNRYDFNNLPDTSTGTPVNLYYQPQITAGVASGTIELWPIPNDSTTVITIDYQRPFQNMDADANNFDFPAYWIQALIYTLAWVLAPEYGIPIQDRQLIATEAKYWKEEALSYGTEEGSLFMQPSRRI